MFTFYLWLPHVLIFVLLSNVHTIVTLLNCAILFAFQPDNNTAQYVLKMMISQHKFYRTELEDTPGLSWLASGVEGWGHMTLYIRS